MDYEVHRIAGSKYYSASLTEIHNQWTLEDVLDAHIFLDIQEDLQTLQANASED